MRIREALSCRLSGTLRLLVSAAIVFVVLAALARSADAQLSGSFYVRVNFSAVVEGEIFEFNKVGQCSWIRQFNFGLGWHNKWQTNLRRMAAKLPSGNWVEIVIPWICNNLKDEFNHNNLGDWRLGWTNDIDHPDVVEVYRMKWRDHYQALSIPTKIDLNTLTLSIRKSKTGPGKDEVSNIEPDLTLSGWAGEPAKRHETRDALGRGRVWVVPKSIWSQHFTLPGAIVNSKEPQAIDLFRYNIYPKNLRLWRQKYIHEADPSKVSLNADQQSKFTKSVGLKHVSGSVWELDRQFLMVEKYYNVGPWRPADLSRIPIIKGIKQGSGFGAFSYNVWSVEQVLNIRGKLFSTTGNHVDKFEYYRNKIDKKINLINKTSSIYLPDTKELLYFITFRASRGPISPVAGGEK